MATHHLRRIIPAALTPEDWGQIREDEEGRDDEAETNDCGYTDDDP